MKRIFLSFLAVLVAVAGFACTNLIVGKGASADGSVICTYNCDGFGFASALTYSAPGRHAKGEMLAIRSWGASEPHYIKEAEYTYATMVAYVPVYCGANIVPEPFRRENNDIREFSWGSAFWVNNFVANMVYPRWSAMIGDLREAQKELEDYYADDPAATRLPHTHPLI